ncbi:hypothetical protein V8G54_033317 [Vigna mungo]|uniref:Amine oxidase domain-containing protein n=1 Tax=Vigna mungo TaxID=3915 RepID=A0AAQ3MPK7_VIGMU
MRVAAASSYQKRRHCRKEPNKFGPTCRICIGGATERGPVMAIESMVEGLKAEMRALTHELHTFNCAHGRHSKNQDRSSEGSRDSVNVERERRPPETSEEEAEEDRGDVQRNWMKRIELPTFEGADPMGWIAKAEKFFDLQNVTKREKMKLVYVCMERGASYYWIRFWRKKTRHPTWKMFIDAMMRRFGELNQGIFEILVMQASGKPYHSSLSIPIDLGATIITGVEDDVATKRRPDPCAQLGLELTVLNSDCPPYDMVTEQKVLADRDEALEAEYNTLIDDMALVIRRTTRTKSSEETDQNNSADRPFDSKRTERRVMDWHFAPLEFFVDVALVTNPLGCLKAETIQFSPPLEQRKCSSVQLLGYGVLNKDDVVDYVGATTEERNSRGHRFMFWNVRKTVSAPILIALVVGKAAIDGQSLSSSDHVKHTLKVLRKLFGHDSVPNPVAYIVTDSEDYDILGIPVDNCLFFVGEATCQEHKDIIGGAMMSGLRESVRIIDILSTGNDYIAEGETLEATQEQLDTEKDEVRDIIKRLDVVRLSESSLAKAVASGFPSYENTMMKRSQEIQFHNSNLEDKVVLQQGAIVRDAITRVVAARVATVGGATVRGVTESNIPVHGCYDSG